MPHRANRPLATTSLPSPTATSKDITFFRVPFCSLSIMLVVCLRHIRVRLEEQPLLPLHHLQHYAVGVITRSWSCSIRVAAAAGIIGTKSIVQCGAEQARSKVCSVINTSLYKIFAQSLRFLGL